MAETRQPGLNTELHPSIGMSGSLVRGVHGNMKERKRQAILSPGLFGHQTASKYSQSSLGQQLSSSGHQSKTDRGNVSNA